MTIYIRIQSITFKSKLKVIRLHLLLQDEFMKTLQMKIVK